MRMMMMIMMTIMVMMMMSRRGRIALQVSLGGHTASPPLRLLLRPALWHALRLCRHSSPVRIVVVVVSRVLVGKFLRLVVMFLGTLLVVLERVDHDKDDRACVILCLTRHS